jgi:N-acetylmuramoyl-L-alanine amidase
MLFISIKKRTLVIILVIVLAVSAFLSLPAIFTQAKTFAYTIVIDPGHGGFDGGMVSPYSGADENHLNLEYALTLKGILNNAGIGVTLTRKSLNGLYSLFADNRKKDDMKKRIKIIEKSGASAVVSIHMNSFGLKSSRGAQVFFKEENQSSEALANNIQKVFFETLPHARQQPRTGDYYILNESPIPSVIVECGFLTNPDEEALLTDKSYMKKVCTALAYGIIISL